MESTQKELTIQPATWGPEVEDCIAGKVPHVPVDVAREVVEGGGALFQVKAESGALVGYYILTIEGEEGVLYLGVGNEPGFDLTGAIVPVVETQFPGCKAIRIHTRRPGLARKLTAMGYEPELVLRKRI